MNTTGRYLLTGAGFTHNFGAPLAREMWGMILNALPSNSPPTLRARILSSFDFEGVYDAVMREPDSDSRAILSRVLASVYESIDRIVRDFSFTTGSPYPVNIYKVQELIAAFAGSKRYPGFAFTLNQDLFLERHYYNGPRPNMPGIAARQEWFSSNFRAALDRDSLCRLPTVEVIGSQKSQWMHGQRFHYLKLHGSCNWVSADDSARMVIGRGKEHQIAQEPLLAWYFDLFTVALNVPESRLLIIGYGFGDPHINRAIASAVADSRLKVFVLTPEPAAEFRKSLGQQPHGDEIWKGLAGYFETTLARLYPQDQSVTAEWRNIVAQFLDGRALRQDPA